MGAASEASAGPEPPRPRALPRERRPELRRPFCAWVGLPGSFGTARLISATFPQISCRGPSLKTLSTASSVLKAMKPKPRERLESGSYMTTESLISPNSEK